AVRVEHADVGAWTLEAGEAPRRVADAAHAPLGEGRPQCRRHGVEAEDVADLHDAAGGRGGGDEAAPLVGGRRERFFDQAVAPGGEARRADRQVTVGRRHDVHRVDGAEGGVVIGRGAIRRHTLPDRPGPTSRPGVGDPGAGAELAQHAQVLFAPAAEADEQDVDRRALLLDEIAAEVLGDFVVEHTGYHPAHDEKIGGGDDDAVQAD